MKFDPRQAIGIVAFALNVWGNLELTKVGNRGHIIRLCSNACWLVYSPLVGAWALMLNHMTFAAINCLGFYRWRKLEKSGAIRRGGAGQSDDLIRRAHYACGCRHENATAVDLLDHINVLRKAYEETAHDRDQIRAELIRVSSTSRASEGGCCKVKKNRPQAKDIPDEKILAVIRDLQGTDLRPGGPPWERWTCGWDIADRLGLPEKLVNAKLSSLKRRGIIDGCPCGCRGDWHFREDPEKKS